MEELCFFGRTARSPPTATSCSRRGPGASGSSPSATRPRRGPVGLGGIVNRVFPGGRRDVRRRPARAEPAPGRDGRDRGAAVHAQAPDPNAQHVPRRDLRDPAADRPRRGCASRSRARPASRSTSSAPATPRSSRSIRRSCARGGWAATCGSGRRPRTTARTSSTCIWARWPTTTDLDTPQAARRARADHERLLAGDGRAGVLDGAHESRTTTAGWRSPGTTSSRR